MEDYFKSEKFYTNLLNASKYSVKTFHKECFNKDQLIEAGFDYGLSRLNDIKITGNDKEDFYSMVKIVGVGQVIYLRKLKHECLFSDLEVNNLSLNYKVYNNMFCTDLKKFLLKFLDTYNLRDRKIILLYLRRTSMSLICKKLRESLIYVSDLIRSFRFDFSNYLIEIGYLNEDFNNVKHDDMCKNLS